MLNLKRYMGMGTEHFGGSGGDTPLMKHIFLVPLQKYLNIKIVCKSEL